MIQTDICFRMKWLSKDVMLVLLGLTAAAGVGAAGASLYQALTAARVLVSVGTVGTTALSSIQYEAQEKRRTVLQVLAAENLAGRRARSAEARSEDASIATHFQELVDLDASAANRAKVAALRDNWKSYMDLRESVISLVLEGKLAEARALEAGPSSVAFERTAAGLQALQQSLADFSAQQQETVRTGMRKALAELGALAITSILFVATLIWSRRKQRKLIRLQSLAEQLERERGRILEMAGRYEPLLAILQVLVSVTQKQLPGSVAGVSVIQDGRLRDVVAPGLPKGFLEVAYPRGAVMRHEDAAIRRNEALAHGLSHYWSQEILSSTGNQIGCVDVYLDKPSSLGEAQTTLLEGVAKLAGIIIQHREMYEQLAFQATCDPLTGLPNRRVFQDRLEQAILRAHRDEEKVAVMLIDLDRFKQVNDLLGHHVGDALLREVAHRVGGCLRKSDTLSRIGGDEFTVLLNPVESVDGAEKALRRIAEALQAPLTILDHKISVSASIGLSVYPDHGEDPATLMRNADLAMYDAKGHGKNGWQTYVPELGATMLRRMSIEKALESALENAELELHYQLQTDLERHLTGVEALVRWHNPELGQVLPLTFVPVAEESGLIIPIGAWVLEQACCKAASWLKAGFPIGRIAVNVSARQLGQSGFVTGVRSALERSGLSPHYLELELTESALMYSFVDCMHRLRDLRELGVSVAIDDFGTGYSSLSYLQKLPVSRVKIDQSFIHGITDRSQETLPLIRAIVDLAHGLGLTVIAEGVETERQFEALAAAGCDQVQGYLIHRPQPSSQVETALRQFLPDLARLALALRNNIAVPRDVAAAPVSIGAPAHRGWNPR
jgi:diguanylate cyclase (GGDEF)-like protein